jgi:hypothetical protein
MHYTRGVVSFISKYFLIIQSEGGTSGHHQAFRRAHMAFCLLNAKQSQGYPPQMVFYSHQCEPNTNSNVILDLLLFLTYGRLQPKAHQPSCQTGPRTKRKTRRQCEAEVPPIQFDSFHRRAYSKPRLSQISSTHRRSTSFQTKSFPHLA